MSIKLRERKLSKGATKFYLDIYYNGERSYEFLDIKIEPDDSRNAKKEKKELAKLIRSNREIELISLNTDYLPKHLKEINFFLFAKSFIKNYKKRDIRMIQATLNKFAEFANNPKLKLSEIDRSLMINYMDYLNHESGLNGTSPHNYFTRFKKIIKDAELKGLISKNPTVGIKFIKNPSDNELKKQVLTSDELKILANTECGNNELKKAFLFCCYTGLGYAEIKNLKWKNIRQNRLITRREKTNKKIDLKLKDSILKMIGEKKKNEDFIFQILNENGLSISDNGVNKCLKNWVERAKIDKHITFYCGRHTFATQLLIHGANLKTVADALGHSTTQHTIKYLNYIDSLKDDAVDNLPDLN